MQGITATCMTMYVMTAAVSARSLTVNHTMRMIHPQLIVDEINVKMPAEKKCTVYQSKHTAYPASMSITVKRIIHRNKFVMEVLFKMASIRYLMFLLF